MSARDAADPLARRGSLARPHRVLVALALLVLGAGCTFSPAPLEDEPALQTLRARPEPGTENVRIAVAPVRADYPSEADLGKDPSVYPADVDVAALQLALVASIGEFSGFVNPITLTARTRDAAFAEAQERGADIVVFPRLTRFEDFFEGRNWSWFPSVALFLYLWFPSWFIPDEDFGARAELEMRFHHVASERLIHEARISAEEVRALNDFERGWSVFGIFTVPHWLDKSDYRDVGEVLDGHAARSLLVKATLEVGQALPARLRAPDAAARDAAVVALVVGVSSYEAHTEFPGSAGAAPDAVSMTALLSDHEGIPAKNILTLTDDRASGAAIRDALTRVLAARVRPRDTVLVYLSGCGATAGGEPCFVPRDGRAEDVSGTAIPLREVVDAVRRLRAAQAIVIVDAGFAGRGGPAIRSARGEAGAAPSEEALASLTAGAPGLSLLVASGPGEAALDLPEAQRGLMSYLLEQGARGAAVAGTPGRCSLDELAAYLARLVPAQAGLDGVRQTPRLYRDGRAASLDAPATGSSWLPVASPEAP